MLGQVPHMYRMTLQAAIRIATDAYMVIKYSAPWWYFRTVVVLTLISPFYIRCRYGKYTVINSVEFLLKKKMKKLKLEEKRASVCTGQGLWTTGVSDVMWSIYIYILQIEGHCTLLLTLLLTTWDYGSLGGGNCLYITVTLQSTQGHHHTIKAQLHGQLNKVETMGKNDIRTSASQLFLVKQGQTELFEWHRKPQRATFSYRPL